MRLNTGKVCIPIEFDNGDVQEIYFNPSDPNIMIRLSKLGNGIEEKINSIEDFGLKNDGTPNELAFLDAFNEFQEIFFTEMDCAFGSDISKKVFKHCSPFAIVDGQYFVLQFMESITPIIEKYVVSAREEAEKKMEKHIGKYKK